MSPDEVIVTLNLDKAARLERDRRQATGRPQDGYPLARKTHQRPPDGQRTLPVVLPLVIVVANTLAAALVVAELATLKPMKTLSLRQRVQAPRRA